MYSIFHLFVVLVVIAVSCEGVVWQDCGSTFGTVKDVQVSGCPSTTDLCLLKKGSNATVQITFTTKEDVTKATTVVHGVIAHVPIPFPVDNPDACKDSGLLCPLKNGQQYVYSKQLEVKDSYPSIQLVVHWEIKDQSSKDIVCVDMPVKIVSVTSGRKL